MEVETEGVESEGENQLLKSDISDGESAKVISDNAAAEQGVKENKQGGGIVAGESGIDNTEDESSNQGQVTAENIGCTAAIVTEKDADDVGENKDSNIESPSDELAGAEQNIEKQRDESADVGSVIENADSGVEQEDCLLDDRKEDSGAVVPGNDTDEERITVEKSGVIGNVDLADCELEAGDEKSDIDNDAERAEIGDEVDSGEKTIKDDNVDDASEIEYMDTSDGDKGKEETELCQEMSEEENIADHDVEITRNSESSVENNEDVNSAITAEGRAGLPDMPADISEEPEPSARKDMEIDIATAEECVTPEVVDGDNRSPAVDKDAVTDEDSTGAGQAETEVTTAEDASLAAMETSETEAEAFDSVSPEQAEANAESTAVDMESGTLENGQEVRRDDTVEHVKESDDKVEPEETDLSGNKESATDVTEEAEPQLSGEMEAVMDVKPSSPEITSVSPVEETNKISDAGIIEASDADLETLSVQSKTPPCNSVTTPTDSQATPIDSETTSPGSNVVKMETGDTPSSEKDGEDSVKSMEDTVATRDNTSDNTSEDKEADVEKEPSQIDSGSQDSSSVTEKAVKAEKMEEGSAIDQKNGDDASSIKTEAASGPKIVGVTSAVGVEDQLDAMATQDESSGLGIKISAVSGGLDTDGKKEEDAVKKTEAVKVDGEKTKAKVEEKEKKDVKKEAKSEDDDVIAVKTEKKPAKPKSSSKIQKCIVCSKVGKCKYNIVRNGDVKHLCDDVCFNRFRSNPTTYLRQAEAGDKKQETTPTQTKTTNNSVAPPKSQAVTPTQTKSPGQQQTAGQVYKTCTVCQLMNVRTSKPFLNWQGLDYCGEECLGKFQADLSVTCNYCSSQIKQSIKARYCWRVGNEVKHFCSINCNNEFVKRMKLCAFCNKDLAQVVDSFMAPVGNQGTFKDFCSQACLQKFEDKNSKDVDVVGVQKNQIRTAPKGNYKCSVCGKIGPVKHEVKLDTKLHQLCSDPCLSAFQYANKLSLARCDNCGTKCPGDEESPQYVQFEGQQKRFCSFMCVNTFRNTNKKIKPCAWCGTKKTNFDMIERVDANNKYQLFCTLNCLSLYRVNLQATSNQAVVCDQCRKFVPAQYHLTMSDASVRNFCSYGCVMQFQAQFQTPAKQIQQQQQQQQTATKCPPPLQPQATQQTTTTTRSGRVVSRVTAQQPTPTPTRQSARVNSRSNSGDSIPIISNVVSLAPQGNKQQQINIKTSTPVTVTGQQTGTIKTTTTGNQTVQQQIIIQPPPPKAMRNKSLLCKPISQTKATSCRPHTQTKDVQTDGKAEPEKHFIPFPVPIYCPTPLAMYSLPTPILVPFPVPIPVPVFIPTTKKSAGSILKQIKEIQEKIPADPLEAELLMMAEAVAEKDSGSSSESEEETTEAAAPDTKEVTPAPPTTTPATATGGGELGEDMLQMALRMASEMSDEPVMDLETSLEPVAVSTVPPPAPIVQEVVEEEEEEYIPTGRSRRSRGGATKRQTRSTPRRNTKRQKVEVQPEFREMPPATPPQPAPPPPDANFHLKYTYGVNAFKHWVMQKNAQLEQTVKPEFGRSPKTFKMDILQCTADELNFSLCLFVKEVRKPNGEEYAVDSIYYLCLGIQQYLFESGRIDNIFTDIYYERFTEALNEILTRYEPKLNHAGQLVCRIEEEHLWESKQLGAHSPHVLLNSLVYFNTKFFMLKTSEDHLKLSFTHIMKHWKKTASGRGSGTGPNAGRSVYLRYYCPTPQSKEANAQKKKKEEMPVYEQTENLDNPLRCPVKLYEFYLSKCPESIKNRNDTFYLVPERSCVPDSPVWYSTSMLGIDQMAKMLNRVRLVREIQEAHLHTQPIYI